MKAVQGKLVPGKNGSRGAKWIADSNSDYAKSLAKSWGKKGRECKVTIKVKKGTTQWLKDNGVLFDVIGDEKSVAKNVIFKSTEPGAMGIGADLLEEFNSRITGMSYATKNAKMRTMEIAI